MPRRLPTLLPATLLLVAMAGSTAIGRPLKPEQEAQIRPSGKPVSCIPIMSIRDTRVRDDSTIDFYMNGHTVYRNKLPQSCPQLGFEEKFAYETSLSELCSADIIHVLMTNPPMPGAACGLGQFQPVTGEPR